MGINNTSRFSKRVDDYVKYRPHYPDEIISYLKQQFNLTPDKIIADIGAGTGISTLLFLKNGYKVFAVEPNKEMREKSIELLQPYAEFIAIDGTAENTTLATDSVDLIVAGQAFHWFDREKTKIEFKRILRHGGMLILMWNERLVLSDFEKDYEQLIIKHGNDYIKVDHRNIEDEDIAAFFKPGDVTIKQFANQQIFDFEGLEGRLLSSSYMPAKNEAGYEEMVQALKILFDRFAENGVIKINYDTKVYAGVL